MFIDPLVIPQVKQVRLGKVNVTVIEHKTITNGKDTGTMPPASEKESDSFIVGKDTGNMKRSKKNEKI